jgi:sulfur carrier protein ThiS
MPYIRVKLYGTLRRLSVEGTPGLWQGEIPDGMNVLELITLLGTREAEVATAAIDGVAVPLDAEIPDNATVTLVTPVGGGAC